MEAFQIINTTPESVKNYGLCGYKDVNKTGYAEKLDWYAKNKNHGLVIKVLYSNAAGTQGMMEYIDGEYCWRPVAAEGYLFIHCLFVGFKKEYKHAGLASRMLADCYQDAIKKNKNGVAVIARKGSFMAKADIFLKNHYELVENIPPDFQLLVKKIEKEAPDPVYINNNIILHSHYEKGLYILRADQCPYTVKNVSEMVTLAEREFNIQPTIVNITNHREAQQNPSPFGTFALICNGKILSHHPISKTRLGNILRKKL